MSGAPAGSKLDPFKEWICEQLQADPTIPSLRLREMATEIGYGGGKTIFDDYVREVRPRFLVRRTFQRTIYRPGELVQCDLWEPRGPIPVGYGQTRRGWVVTAELCWSRVIAGSAGLLQGGAGHSVGPGAVPEPAGGAAGEAGVGPRGSDRAPAGDPTERVRVVLRAARGRLGHPRCWGCAGEGRARALAPVHALELRAGPAVREPPGLPGLSWTRWCERVNGRVHRTIRAVPAERLVEERTRMRPLRPVARHGPAVRWCGCRSSHTVRVDRNDYSIDPRFAGRRVEVRVSQTQITAAVLDTGELACRHRRVVRRRADDRSTPRIRASSSASASAPPTTRGRRRDPTAVAL